MNLTSTLNYINNNNNKGENIEDSQIVKNSIYNAEEKVLGYRKRVPKKEWMMPKIFSMMEERK